MSPFKKRMGSCALLGNGDIPARYIGCQIHCSEDRSLNQPIVTLEMQFFVTIVDFVLSLCETWLIARL